MTRMSRSMAACALALLAVTGLTSTAAAAVTDDGCDQTYSKPFTPWLDYLNYAKVPGGSFENGLQGWKVSGGAKVVADQEPWKVSGDKKDGKALYLPRGASVTSPSFCGGLTHPTVRLFAKGGLLPVLSGVRVDILYTGKYALLPALPLGIVLPTRTWRPSLPLLTLSGLPLLTGAQLAVRISAIGTPATVDDVYVDPFRRH